MINNKIYFSIPGYFHQYDTNIALLKLKQKFPEKFYDDIIIDSIYDCFPNSIWNGGRVCLEKTVPIKDMKDILYTFNEFGLSIRHTFTNELLENTDLYDRLSNKILEISSNTLIKTGININSELLKNYIEDKYPNIFYFNWSATKCLKDIDEINHLSCNNLVIPSYQSINNNFEIINNLLYPNNIEFIVDECCFDKCPFYTSHYKKFNKEQLYINDYDAEICRCQQSPNYYERRTNRKHNISIDLIREKYLPLGFNKFKITGREEFPFNLIESYVNYFVKKEYRDFIRNSLLSEVYG